MKCVGGAVFAAPPFEFEMKKKIYAKIADIPFQIELQNECLEQYYKDYLCEPTEDAAKISVSESELQQVRQMYITETSEYLVELNEHILRVGDRLLDYDKCVFHGSAFLWHDKAWIFTAPSGTGKTSQYVLWKMLFDDEICILNGDKPVLEFLENQILVHPSPWRGKENMGIKHSAPIGGIIYLRQGRENHMETLCVKQAVQPIFGQFLFSASNATRIKQVAALEERLLRLVRTWQFTNCGDKASARFSHNWLCKEMEGE